MRRVTRFGSPLALLALACVLTAAADEPPLAPPPRPAGTTPAAEPGQAAILSKEAYILPPKVIADAVLASRAETVALTNLSPDGRKFLVARRDAMPPLERLGCPCVHLAEMAFDPVALRSRDLWVSSSEAYDLFFPAENRTVRVKSPSGARVAGAAWSPDGSKLAFLALFPDATHVCVADAESGSCRKVTTTPVLASLVTTLQWTNDGRRVATVLLPDDGKRPTPRPGVATEPMVRVARDGKDPSRTYRYLLESPFEAQLLEHILTGQTALVDVTDGSVTKVGPPAMVRGVSASPAGTHFRVTTVKKPFSYYAPFTRFGSTEAIWDAAGKSLFTLADRNLRETEPQPVPVNPTPAPPTGKGTGRPTGKNPTGFPQPPADPNPDPNTQPDPNAPPARPPFGDAGIAPAPFDPDARRDITWRPDGKGISYLQMEPAGKDDKKDAKADEKKDDKAVRKDRVMHWLPPFGEKDAKAVYESPNRITGVQYSADCRWMFVTQTVDGLRQITAIDSQDPKTAYVVYKATPQTPKKDGPATRKDDSPKRGGPEDEGPSDGEQPGGFQPGAVSGLGLMTRPTGGASVVRVSRNGEVYMTGSDRAPKGEAGGFAKPYIEAVDIKTGKKTRVFEGKGDALETVDAVDADFTRVFTTRQKSDVVPDSYVTEVPSGRVTKLTGNVDHSPWFRKVKTERFRVTRADGFKFWVTVKLPPDAKGKLPALFWIYPREYADQAAYDQRAGAGGLGGLAAAAGGGRFRSPGPRSVEILTLLGYAVVEPDVPIVGPAGRMNDNYVPDLRNSLWAAIDECDKRGYIDRDRLACGGHSYGAFSTANALAHTPFFKAGIAGDGCYNRTLTSMSFQSERRLLWDARETYLEMSPLLWADRVNGALLMYHGMEDANVGTNPINSEALFAALDGLGKNASLYMYPYEGHGPLARETNLDMWARWVAWLDLYVMNPKKK